MSYYNQAAPTELFRVEDSDSSAIYVHRKGIFAGADRARVDFNSTEDHLFRVLKKHLDWDNRSATPFISAYADKEAAKAEARRRKAEGKQDVRIYVINTNRRGAAVEYRNVRRLAKKVGLFISKKAWHNSEHECIFLHHIPERMVVRTIRRFEGV
ncbi:hypothetical protein DE146DRAFT_659918 [Phaeosphaeria sp. MPI-PUGE-AT-0046c]|nr:hypothetical protein DE146DRAFT_659918 [Phaeosphaeria sp. MPI-PUGE-AT-0046c]